MVTTPRTTTSLSSSGTSSRAARTVLAHIWLGSPGYIIQEDQDKARAAAAVAEYAALSGHVVTLVDPEGTQAWARTSSFVRHIISSASALPDWTLDVSDDERPLVMIVSEYTSIRSGSEEHLLLFDAAVTRHLTTHPNVDLFIVVLTEDAERLFDPEAFPGTPRGTSELLFPWPSSGAAV